MAIWDSVVVGGPPVPDSHFGGGFESDFTKPLAGGIVGTQSAILNSTNPWAFNYPVDGDYKMGVRLHGQQRFWTKYYDPNSTVQINGEQVYYRNPHFPNLDPDFMDSFEINSGKLRLLARQATAADDGFNQMSGYLIGPGGNEATLGEVKAANGGSIPAAWNLLNPSASDGAVAYFGKAPAKIISAQISTYNRCSLSYGKTEAVVRAPCGAKGTNVGDTQAWFPAFWNLLDVPAAKDLNGRPLSTDTETPGDVGATKQKTEFDIMELFFDDKVHVTTHLPNELAPTGRVETYGGRSMWRGDRRQINSVINAIHVAGQNIKYAKYNYPGVVHYAINDIVVAIVPTSIIMARPKLVYEPMNTTDYSYLPYIDPTTKYAKRLGYQTYDDGQPAYEHYCSVFNIADVAKFARPGAWGYVNAGGGIPYTDDEYMEIDYHVMQPLLTDNPDSRPFIDYKAGDNGGSGVTILDIPQNEFPTGYAISEHNGYLSGGTTSSITVTSNGPTVSGTSEGIQEGTVVEIKSGQNKVGSAIISSDGSWVVATGKSIPAHGRTDENSTINPITSLILKGYSSSYVDVLFTQPTSQEGYQWEVWINGTIQVTTKKGSYGISTEPNQVLEVAVSSRRGESYSLPWVATITAQSGAADVVGAVGSWSEIGSIDYSRDDSVKTVRVASKPWLSDSYQAYDDFLISRPEVQDSLDNFGGVGDIDVLHPDDEVKLSQYNWRGYKARMLHGDTDWPRARFKSIATSMIDGCKAVGGRKVRFDIMDHGQSLNRTFTDADVTKDISAKSTIAWIMQQAELPPVEFINVDQVNRDFRVRVAMTKDSKIDDTVRKITDSIGAYTRISQTGNVQVFIPNLSTPILITEDDISHASVRQLQVTPAYRKVTVILEDGTEITEATRALTGDLDEELRINTLLYRPEDARVIINDKVLYHSSTHAMWSMRVFDVVNIVQVGDYVDIRHNELTGIGYVTYIKRSPLSNHTEIEVSI